MLATLLIWGYSFGIFYIYGYGGMTFLKKIFQLRDEVDLSFPIIAALGIAVLVTLVSFLSLFIPISATAAILVLIGGVFLAILTQPWKNFHLPSFHPLVLALLIIVAIAVLENSTHRPSNYDTALYHAQTIHWIESYRAVPGLVNINSRLAYNSSWLVLVSSLSFAFLGLRSFHLTNSVLLLISIIYFSEGIQGFIQKQFTVSNIVKAVFFFLPLYLYASDLSSPGTDLPPTLLTWMVTAMMIEKIDKQGLNIDLYSVSIFIICIVNVALKLSSLPLCGLAFLILVQQLWNRNWRHSAILATAALIILSAWFLRNMIISGYLIFPVPQIDLFSFDWKYPLSSTISASNALLWYDKFPDAADWTKYIGMPASQWIPLWFHHLPRDQKVLLLIAIASPIGFLAYRFGKAVEKIEIGIIIAFLINYAGIFFWMFTSPLFRFGYVYFFASIILGSIPAILRWKGIISNRESLISLTLVIFAIIFQALYSSYYNEYS